MDLGPWVDSKEAQTTKKWTRELAPNKCLFMFIDIKLHNICLLLKSNKQNNMFMLMYL